MTFRDCISSVSISGSEADLLVLRRVKDIPVRINKNKIRERKIDRALKNKRNFYKFLLGGNV